MKGFLILVVLGILIQLSTQQTATPSTEKSALLDIYNNMGGANWFSTQRKNNVSTSVYVLPWAGNTADPCGSSSNDYFDAWYGVICSKTGSVSNVVTLLLPFNNLIGTIPSTINGLTKLTKLLMMGNKITGALPNTLPLTLTHLYIFNNSISNVQNANRLTNLQKLYFDYNSVSHDLSFTTTLTKLTELDGSGNSITGSVPTFAQNTALTNVKLGYNQLTGSFPAALLNHPSLVFIRLQNNLLSGALPDANMGSKPLLQLLNLANNNLNCALPPWLASTYFNVDLSGQQFFCPISVTSFVTVSKTCTTITQTGISPTQFQLLGNSGSITISGTNYLVCPSSYQCIFQYPGTSNLTISTSSSVTNTAVTCPFPTFPRGGQINVCLGQYNKSLVSSCSPLRLYYNCTAKCGSNGVCDPLTGNCICKVGWKGPLCDLRDCGDCNEPIGGYCNTTSGKCICYPNWLGPQCNFGNISCTPKYNCSNGAQCDGYTGTCQCKLGWQGDNCTQIYCPPCDPRGGYCSAGKCICVGNWTGPLCNIPTGNCSGDCGFSLGHGRCNKITATCDCITTWFGDNCQYKSCPLNCSGNGVCNTTDGTCTCYKNYTGVACSNLNLTCPNMCSGHGYCNPTTGLCYCYLPYLGADCSYANCPLSCSGHGTCDKSTGDCTCNFPWTGPSCGTPNNTCPNNCSGVGICNKVTGVCNCGGSFNADCSARTCIHNCSGHGTCDTITGSCKCDDGWGGDAGDCGSPFIPCLPDPTCNKSGLCDTTIGKCICRRGYEGVSCEKLSCPNNCTYPNGTCDYTTGKCFCNSKHTGSDCSSLVCAGECNNNGTCDHNVGVCSCNPGFRGSTCSIIRCPYDCSGKGTCAGGVCHCQGLWYGPYCNLEKPDYTKIALLTVGLFLLAAVLIVAAFLIWRAVKINELKQQLDQMKEENQGQNLEDISSSSDD